MSESAIFMLLIAWTGIGVSWWFVAIVLVARASRSPEASAADDNSSISIFKPIPSPLGERELAVIVECLESFAADLDANSELLIGAGERERAAIEAFVERMRGKYPRAEIKILIESPGEPRMHPKVAWNRKLSELATGELWLWSDADIRVPPGTIASLRADREGSSGMITSPYVVSGVESSADMLDALFVNAEFYPGVELLARTGGLRGGFGAGMLFGADEFRARVDWAELGSHLAEDFVLGTQLAPVRLASTRLSTAPASTNWKAAVLHYLRWQKTIRWCQPGGFAAQIIVLPVVGWLAWLVAEPSKATTWYGLGVVLCADAVAALTISRLVGCRVGLRHALAIPLWSLLRGVTWIACWLPWPVVWRGRRWWSPRLYETGQTGTADREALH